MSFNIDILLNSDGDIELTPDGDIKVIKDTSCKIQTAKNVIKSITKDWFYDEIGSNLEQLFGLNINVAQQKGTDLIYESLQKYSLFNKEDIHVEAVQKDNTLIYVISIMIDGEIVIIEANIDLTSYCINFK